MKFFYMKITFHTSFILITFFLILGAGCSSPLEQKDGAEEWGEYTNEDFGISFQYPVRFGTPSTTVRDYRDFTTSGLSGKEMSVHFLGEERYWWNFFLVGYTSDYHGMIYNEFINPETGSAQLACGLPLAYDDYGNVCKIIKNKQGENIRIANQFLVGECVFGGLGTEIHLNNKSDSQYTGLVFGIILTDASGQVGKFFDFCVNESEELDMKLKSEVMAQSQNIMEKKNLSEQDEQDLEDFYSVIDSLKFL